jgi:2-oxoglutarate ferredoxin oxidoreductase subunit alpha
LKLRERGIKIGMIRPVTLWPFPEKIIGEIAGKLKYISVIEMNLGQMVEDVRLAVNGKCPVEFFGKPGGAIFTVDEIISKIK